MRDAKAVLAITPFECIAAAGWTMSDTAYKGQLAPVHFLNVVLILFLVQALWALAATTMGVLVCIPFVVALTWERARVARRVVRVVRLIGDDIELESVGLLGVARDVTRVKRSAASLWRFSANWQGKETCHRFCPGQGINGGSVRAMRRHAHRQARASLASPSV